MLAYPLEEAEGLLKDKLQKAQRGLEEVREDEGFVREQITVCLSFILPSLVVEVGWLIATDARGADG